MNQFQHVTPPLNMQADGISLSPHQSLEIERKFLVFASELPAEILTCPSRDIRQGYLAIQENREVRIRQFGDEYFQTVKIGSGLTRIEQEFKIEKSVFDGLWPLIVGRGIEKQRYDCSIYIGQDNITVDIFGGHLQGLVVLEVEFPSTTMANGFFPPQWVKNEVTTDKRFKNSSLV